MLRSNSVFGSSNNQLEKSAQRSNVLLNIVKIGMDLYSMFHDEHHLAKTCLQWNQLMRRMVMRFIELVMVEEHVELDEEKEEVATANQAPSIGNAVNMYHCVLTSHKSTTDK